MNMRAVQHLNLGIVGACERGASFKDACDALDHGSIHAVCDTNIRRKGDPHRHGSEL